MLARADVEKWRAQMDAATARRLQPHYIRVFFLEAFKLLGRAIAEREAGRYEIRHVPAAILERDRQIGLGAPVLRSHERVTFDRELTRPGGKPRGDLLAPGHPLLDAVTGRPLATPGPEGPELKTSGGFVARLRAGPASSGAALATVATDRHRP